MLTILTVFLCYHSAHNVCIEVTVPTSVTFQCGLTYLPHLTSYLAENYPRAEYKTFVCTPGRMV
jgi:hypothetical protein